MGRDMVEDAERRGVVIGVEESLFNVDNGRNNGNNGLELSLKKEKKEKKEKKKKKKKKKNDDKPLPTKEEEVLENECDWSGSEMDKYASDYSFSAAEGSLDIEIETSS